MPDPTVAAELKRAAWRREIDVRQAERYLRPGKCPRCPARRAPSPAN